jgi:hypothetical protein
MGFTENDGEKSIKWYKYFDNLDIISGFGWRISNGVRDGVEDIP